MLMQNFGGTKIEYYGKFENGLLQKNPDQKKNYKNKNTIYHNYTRFAKIMKFHKNMLQTHGKIRNQIFQLEV